MAAGASEEAVSVDLTATQYVILAENQRKKAALAATKESCAALQAENAALLAQLEAANRDSYQVSEAFRQEVQAKNQRIADLQAQLEQLAADSNERAARLQAAAAAREAELQCELDATSEGLVRRIEELEGEVAGLQEFKAHKAESEAALAALRGEAVGLREALEAQRSQLERHYAGLHAKMRKEYEQKLEELKRSQEEEVEERMDAGVKRILAANRRLAEELHLHVTESDALQAEVALLTTERARLTREVNLKSDLEAGWALRAGQQATALKEAQAKIDALEASLQQLLSDFAAERAAVVASAASQVSDAAGEADALRRLLKLKGRELAQLRALAQEVLLQRSEVEIFLLSSCHQARLAIEQERQAAAAGASTSAAAGPAGSAEQPGPAGAAAPGGGSDATPSTSGRSAACGQQAVAPGCSLDIADLSWAEREGVLRLLFAKINGREAERRAGALPPHAPRARPGDGGAACQDAAAGHATAAAAATAIQQSWLMGGSGT